MRTCKNHHFGCSFFITWWNRWCSHHFVKMQKSSLWWQFLYYMTKSWFSPSPWHTFKASDLLKVYVLKHLEGSKTPSGGQKSPPGDQKSDILAIVKVKNMKSSFLKSFFKQCKRPWRCQKTIWITERNASHLKILFNVDESIIKLSLNYQSFTPEPIPFFIKKPFGLLHFTQRDWKLNFFVYKFYEKNRCDNVPK